MRHRTQSCAIITTIGCNNVRNLLSYARINVRDVEWNVLCDATPPVIFVASVKGRDNGPVLPCLEILFEEFFILSKQIPLRVVA